ncbi:MAG: mechanosensitive ion channel domain-containing protein [Candidatus Odinarchaeia archaeon]
MVSHIVSSQISDFFTYFWSNFGLITIFAIAIIALFLSQKILVKTLKAKYKKVGLSPGSANAITLLIRLIVLTIAVILIVTVITSTFIEAYIDPSWFIGISSLIGIAVGIASAQSLGNIIAGFYVLLSKPFTTGDYVKIGDVEGVVDEITLNYTKIVLPDGAKAIIANNRVLIAPVVNYKVSKGRLGEIIRNLISSRTVDYKISKSRIDKIIKDEEPVNNRRLINMLKKAILDARKLYVYPFSFNVRSELKIDAAKKVFREVCDKWGPIFSYPPIFKFEAAEIGKNTFRFSIITDDPKIILKKRGEFIENLVNEVQKALANPENKTPNPH